MNEDFEATIDSILHEKEAGLYDVIGSSGIKALSIYLSKRFDDLGYYWQYEMDDFDRSKHEEV